MKLNSSFNLILLVCCTKRLNTRGLEGIRGSLLLNTLEIRAFLGINLPLYNPSETQNFQPNFNWKWQYLDLHTFLPLYILYTIKVIRGLLLSNESQSGCSNFVSVWFMDHGIYINPFWCFRENATGYRGFVSVITLEQTGYRSTSFYQDSPPPNDYWGSLSHHEDWNS